MTTVNLCVESGLVLSLERERLSGQLARFSIVKTVSHCHYSRDDELEFKYKELNYNYMAAMARDLSYFFMMIQQQRSISLKNAVYWSALSIEGFPIFYGCLKLIRMLKRQ